MKNFDALIGRAASSLTQRRGDNASASNAVDDSPDGLLFMGNPHETVPRGLLLDQRLGAVDVLGWQVIRLLSNDDRTTAFPTYDELEPLLRSGAKSRASRKTVARVIAILRLTRWMTLGLKARNTENGRMIGNVYVLHDEPLSPAESLSLDAKYVEYVIQCTRHHSTAVTEAALLVCDELAESGVMDVPTRLDILDQRARRQQSSEFPGGTEGEIAEFPKETQANNPSSQRKLGQFPNDQVQSSQGELSRKSTTYSRVPNGNSATTTGSYTNNVCNNTAREETPRDLIWSYPLELTSDERESAKYMLVGLTPDIQQSVIDEVAGRVDAGKVSSPMGLLHSLAKKAVTKSFHLTDFGKKIAKKRQGGGEQEPPQQQPVVPLRERLPQNVGKSEQDKPLSAEAEGRRQDLLKGLGIKR
ncbi:STY4528 family pathogenicity island replication protein [Kushneria indalinina]|uniref:Uncharacterized protein n=1 Tax=Kushneria indalinina DSM 14324 TaxID=1122140 RepID=A0A3D9DRY7_9GAMM|nr:STY4528 family pathogenicity island replication protein [Kushneria indalinina]REC93405.1 hypothetical protein C8D72_3451 [Kushneria indalinina DSM 14324]